MTLRGALAGLCALLAIGATTGPAAAAQLDAVDVASGAQTGGQYFLGGAVTTGGGYSSCPSGTRVVTGGAYPVNQDDVDQYAVTSSSPTLDGKGWYSHAFEEGGTGSSVQVDVDLTCVPAAKVRGTAVRVRTTRFLETRSVTVRCPRNASVYTGGAFVSPAGPDSGPIPELADDALLSASAPLKNGRGWSASVRNQGASPLDLSVTARCLPDKRLARMKVVAETMPPSEFGAVRDRLTCPSNTRLTAAGAAWHKPNRPPDAGSIANSLLEGVASIGRQLEYRGEAAASPALVLTARGFCLR
ncbi:hypothetical protein HJD18_08885 [Thermoleophilia bacterium SCSIO 60948]|nr:hypothetical protein HJD18_08885 [Thermoleophilia bacterium SCSIO 60948]